LGQTTPMRAQIFSPRWGFIHLLLIIAVVVLVIQLIQGRTPPV